MKTKTAIVIITKNRECELEKCLISIKNQVITPEEIIVIDNDKNLSARSVISKRIFSELKINYQKNNGSVPKCRNFALKISSEKYLGFVDDDCVLDKNWLKNGLREMEKKDLAYVLGQTKLLNKNNIFAIAQHARDAYWKKYNAKIFDTKNVLLDLRKIKERKLEFDEKCQSDVYDSADFDFDFQLNKCKLKGSICKKMILFHKETSDYKRFIKRAYHRGKLAKYLNKKWQLNNKLICKKDNVFIFWLLRAIKNSYKEYKRYEKEMGRQTLSKKFLATFFIKVFERYYTLGYMANEKTS